MSGYAGVKEFTACLFLSPSAAACVTLSEGGAACRWQAALRIILSALTSDAVAYIASLAPDAAAAPGTALHPQQVAAADLYYRTPRGMLTAEASYLHNARR